MVYKNTVLICWFIGTIFWAIHSLCFSSQELDSSLFLGYLFFFVLPAIVIAFMVTAIVVSVSGLMSENPKVWSLVSISVSLSLFAIYIFSEMLYEFLSGI